MVFLFKCLCFLFYCSSLLLFSSLDANAFLYFLPDYEPKELIRSAEYCTNNGFNHNLKSCPAPRILKERCPVGNYYKTCYCAGSPTCTGSLSSANPYSNTTGTSRSSCVDCPGNTRYTWTCTRKCATAISSKPSNSTYTTCSDCSGTYKVGWTCNSGYYKSGSSCVCATTCSDTVTSKPSNSSYTTSSCTACGVTTTIKTGWTCNSGYHKSGSACEKDCTPLSSETNCSYGTYNCSDGCGGTRSCCETCTTSSDEESSDESSSNTSSSDESSSITEACQEVANGCTRYLSASKAPSTYTLIGYHCTTTSGTQLNAYTHCSCSGGVCGGKKQCANNKGSQNDGSTEPCTCDGLYLFDKCEDSCTRDTVGGNGGYCGAQAGDSVKRHYYVRDKCTTSDGTVIKLWGSCNSIDCNGNQGPCYGKNECTTGTAVDPCECGNVTYGSSCVIES